MSDQQNIKINPEPGQTVSIFFRNGSRVEGEVVSWSDTKSVLISPAKTTMLIIQKTLEDVMFFKIELANPEEEFIRVKEEHSLNKEDKIKRLSELKKELNELEKEEIRNKLNSHSVGEVHGVQYGLPREFYAIKGPVERAGTKVARESSDIGSELQSLFSKKH